MIPPGGLPRLGEWDRQSDVGGLRLWLATAPADMRWGFDRLSGLHTGQKGRGARQSAPKGGVDSDVRRLPVGSGTRIAAHPMKSLAQLLPQHWQAATAPDAPTTPRMTRAASPA